MNSKPDGKWQIQKWNLSFLPSGTEHTHCKPVPYSTDTILISMNSKKEENSHELSKFVLRERVQRSFFKHRNDTTQARRSGIKHRISWKFFNLRFCL